MDDNPDHIRTSRLCLFAWHISSLFNGELVNIKISIR